VCVCVCASISFPYSTRDGLNRFPGGLRDVDVLEKKFICVHTYDAGVIDATINSKKYQFDATIFTTQRHSPFQVLYPGYFSHATQKRALRGAHDPPGIAPFSTWKMRNRSFHFFSKHAQHTHSNFRWTECS